MKTVWVNRHHADGSVKPMSEWVQVNIHNKTTHIEIKGDKVFQKTYGLNGDIVSSDPRVGVYRYIGNQRGDGWFYVADGDLPPDSYSENIFAHTSTGEYVVIASWLYNSHKVEVIYGKPICWQPIQQPKHLD